MVGRLSWTSKHSQSLGHVSIVISIWSFQLHQEYCRSPYIGVSKVPNHSGAPEENTSRHWQRATKTHPNHGCCELGFAGVCCSGGSRAGCGWALVQPSLCHGPTGHGCSRGHCPSSVSPAPALARLGGSCQHHCLGSLPASQMLLLENLPACQLPKALTGCDLHPGREGGWEQEGHFITQQSR